MSASHPRRVAWWQVDLTGLVACGILTFCAFLVIVRPIAQRRADIASLRARLGVLSLESARTESSRKLIEEELSKMQTELAESPVKLEPADFLNERLASIMNLATTSGIQIHETRSGEVASGDWHDQVPIVVSGRGQYPACAQFLHQVHSALGDIEVRSFELSGNPSDPRANPSFTFELTWYAASTLAAAP